jgi:hypothetical protein
VAATLRDFTAWFVHRSAERIPTAADLALLLVAAGSAPSSHHCTATREGADPTAASDDDSAIEASVHQTCCDQQDHRRAFTPNARTAALAAGAFGPGGPAANPYRCLWMMGAAPRYVGIDRRPDDSSSDVYSARSDFVDAEGGIYLPHIYESTDELSEYHAAVKNERRESRVWRRQQQAARVEAITAVARRLLRAAPDAVPALTLYPTTAPSIMLRAALATQPTAMRALRLDFFKMSQGLAVTLLQRACLAWAESLREVRVDVGMSTAWQFEMSKSVYVALAGCPHLEVVSVPDIFLHYYEAPSPRGATTEGPPRGPAPPYFRTLRHLDLLDGPHSDASWRVICGKLPALHTLVLRFQQTTAPRFIASLASAPLYEHLSSERLTIPSGSSWCAGFSALLQRVRIRRLYLDDYGLTEDIQEALNNVAACNVHTRRGRSGSGSSSSSSNRDTHQDDESGRSDGGACNATGEVEYESNRDPDPDRAPQPGFVRTPPRRRAAEKDLIPLEVFSVYGWRDDERQTVLTPFMRYLARSAPHLREVGLVNTCFRGALALRHAVSTSLTGLALRHMTGVSDTELATLLCSRMGRRLRSLMVEHDDIFDEECCPVYAALMRPAAASAPHDASSSLSDGSDGDASNSGSGNRGSDIDLYDEWWLDEEPRLPRLRRLVVRTEQVDGWTRVAAFFNGPRVMLAPYAVVPLVVPTL